MIQDLGSCRFTTFFVSLLSKIIWPHQKSHHYVIVLNLNLSTEVTSVHGLSRLCILDQTSKPNYNKQITKKLFINLVNLIID